MIKVELLNVEVMNDTAHLFVFQTMFNKQPYPRLITLNMA